MRGGRLTPGILAGSAMLWAGCDPPLCRSELHVAFTQAWISGDVDDFAPGVQTNIGVETSLFPGDLVTLEVFDDSGATVDTLSRAVDASGGARFDYVTLPSPRAVLEASGRGICGEASDEITVDVPAPAMCELRLVPAPEVNAHYAPFGVLSLRSDPDPVTPGYQTTLQVATRPGWMVELVRDAQTAQSLATVAAGGDGRAVLPVTLADGWAAFHAVCRGDGTQLVSSAIAVFADTTPPRCTLVAPAPGSRITWDDDHDPRDGVQFAITGHSPDADVAGEAVSVVLIDTSGATVASSSTTTGDDGTATDEVTLVPAVTPMSFDVALTMHDHAGNACMAVAAYSVSR